ncbi:AAA family ATPase [Burkholderia gladioli]|uniref:AAA family ATPase n=1 Tax=Burkholderia gladioli TaxID=28095 RepID=UPI0030D3D7DA
MKITNFTAEKVYGAYRFDTVFNNDLNFLIGINGSGKTTALRLMQAALTLNLKELYFIEFSQISVSLVHNERSQTIVFNKVADGLRIFLGEQPSEIETLPSFTKDEIEQYVKTGKFDDHVQDIRFRLLRSASLVSKFFRNLRRPIFLGLERRLFRDDEGVFDADDAFAIRNHRLNFSDPRARRAEQSVDGLDSTKILIQEAYRRFRVFSDRSTESLVNVLVESAFKYIDFDPDEFAKNRIGFSEYKQVIARRKEIEDAASRLGGSSKTSGQIGKFFSKMQSLYDISSTKSIQQQMSIEWLLNRSQIQRMHDILTELDRHKKRAGTLYAPIKKFIDTANHFFKDSRKEISVDSVGHLICKYQGQDIPLASLSSGERQLLIIIAHVVLRAKDEAGVIIIDEPELSLHLRWQENLVEKLVELNDSMQFIFATHSPEIIGEYKNKAIQLYR